MRNSEIILVNDMKLDKDYKNVLSYSEENMVSLCRSKSVGNSTNYSFLKPGDNVVNVQFPYSTCLNADYIAFRNPYYSNKWFFAFVDRVEYSTEKATKIYYTIDEFSTWYSYWTQKPCFVIREHVNNDTVGLHTVPENVELGEYVTNGVFRDANLDDLVYVIQVTEWATSSDDPPLATNYGGIFNVGGAYICDHYNDLVNIIRAYQTTGRGSAILNVYIVPKKIVINSKDTMYSGQDSPARYEISISKPSTLDGYTPKNKKLLTSPYQYLVLDNNNGISNILQFENFITDGSIAKFQVSGVPTVGGSIKCVPLNYKNTNSFQQEGIMGGKYPTCGWINDTYTNWLTQNAVNIGVGVISSGLTLVGGVGLMATGAGVVAGAGAITSGALGIASSVGQVYQHSIVPNSASGNVNGGDINTCDKQNCFYFLNMSIKREYAKIIDDFFSRLGYKVNELKNANITGRQNFNYVQIGITEEIGYSSNANISVPASSMESINTIFRNGTTIWHNYNNLGDYSVSNNIV